MGERRRRHHEDQPSLDAPRLSDGAVHDLGPEMTLGTDLRTAREYFGYGLADVARDLRIRQAYLQALEDGRFKDLPGAAYATGFLRTYAEHLGLDPEQILRRFKEESSGAIPRSEFYMPKPVPEGRIPGGAILLLAAVLAGGIYGGWYYLTSTGRDIADLVPPVPERLAAVLRLSPAAPDIVVPVEPDAGIAADAAVDAVQGDVAAPAPIQAAESPAAVAEPPFPAALPLAPATQTPATEIPVAEIPVAEDPVVEDPVTEDPAPAESPSAERLAAASSEPVAEASSPAPDGAAEPAPTQAELPEPVPMPTVAPRRPVEPDVTTALAAPAPTPTRPPTTVPATAPAMAEVPEPADRSDPGGQESAALPPPQPPAAEGIPADGKVYGVVNGASRIHLRATQDSWVQVRGASGDLLFARVLRPGDVYRVPDETGLRLVTGNAGGIVVVVDGVAATGPMGQTGQVMRDVALDPTRLPGG